MTDKPKKKTSPTVRTLNKLRDGGAHLVAVVEKWNRFGGPIGSNGERVGNRVDLFGMIDVLAVMPGQVGTLGIQACAASSLSTRIRKVIDDPVLRQRAKWYEAAGNRLVFWGWKQNKKTKRWEVKERNFSDDLKTAVDFVEAIRQRQSATIIACASKVRRANPLEYLARTRHEQWGRRDRMLLGNDPDNPMPSTVHVYLPDNGRGPDKTEQSDKPNEAKK